MAKYKFTGETKIVDGITLRRIVCDTAFGQVAEGEFGGWIETEDNLSQIDNAWVFSEAMVYGNARVFDEAQVYGAGRVFGEAEVYGKAEVYGDACVFGKAEVYGKARVFSEAKVYGTAKVYDKAQVFGNALVYGNAMVYGDAMVLDNACVHGNVEVSGDAEVSGHATIRNDAVITSTADYIVAKNNWSSGRYFTYTRSNKTWAVGCFNGTDKELIAQAASEDKLKGKCYKATVKYVNGLYKMLGRK